MMGDTGKMAGEMRKTGMAGRTRGNLMENLMIVVLVFYPLRHIAKGIDFWDTGYHYANFQNMGIRHMDPMWLFSTYLSTAAGNFLTKLPHGDTLMGMNLYTGLFVSALALTGYFFCTRKLRIPGWIAFVGEMTAISLCWCPPAALYNYLTYLLFLAAFIFLYVGLTKEKKGCLMAAGVALGANVLARFPNLAQMAMIVAVWAYDLIVWLEDRRQSGGAAAAGETQSGEAARGGAGFWRRTLRHTGWCLLGYVSALAVLLHYIHICYGIDEYIAGITRLFSMTEKAVDYKPTAMIMGIVGRYVESMYWVVRVGVILLGGMALFAVAGWMEALQAGRAASGEKKAAAGSGRLIYTAVRILWAGVCVAMVVWLYIRHFFSFTYYSYDSIWHPGPMFLMLTMLIALVRIFHRNSPKEEKLVSGMLILTILLTSIGGNNGIFPSLNNLFVAAPYTLWEAWRFLRNVGDKRIGRGLVLACFPAKSILVTLTGLCLFQFWAFGAKFVFAEATGIPENNAFVYNNPVLKNIGMESHKAQWMTELSAFANENGLQGKEVIPYGKIPSVSYYLQMPAAFNPWPDLDSYNLKVMEADLARQEAMIGEKGAEKPVIILEDRYALYLEEKNGEKSLFPLSVEEREDMGADPKWSLLMDFMDRMGYRKTFRNEKFAVYQ